LNLNLNSGGRAAPLKRLDPSVNADASGSPVIVGLGAQTAIGLNMPANVAAVRAGLNSFQLSDYLLSYKNGQPLKLSQLETFPRATAPFDRMKNMAVAAAREALTPWLQSRRSGRPSELAVFVSVPSGRPGIETPVIRRLVREIVAELPFETAPPPYGIAATGHEGGLAALGYAVNLIRAGEIGTALLGGVDCYHDPGTLHWLEGQNRILTEDQGIGFVPGEGAGFVLLCSPAEARRMNSRIFSEVLATGRGLEERLWFTTKPCIGQGLTQAFHAAFRDQHWHEQKVRFTYCDLNGESWRADEWSYAYVRTGAHHASPLDLHHPAANWGDVGAASGPLLLALASFELGRYCEPRDVALVWAASDMRPYRSACVLRRP